MREENSINNNPSENKSKVSKFSDQNQPPKLQTTKGTNPNNNHSKPRLWGAHIVKGFSADKKTKQQSTVLKKKYSNNNNHRRCDYRKRTADATEILRGVLAAIVKKMEEQNNREKEKE
jgi:hypothetical protein